MNNPITIEYFRKRNHLSQIYSRGLEYAFVSKDNKMCHEFVFCKDFLNDVIYSITHKMPIHLYGFEFGDKNPRPNSSHISILIANSSDPNFELKKDGLISFLHLIEKKLGLDETAIHDCTGLPVLYKHAFLLKGDKQWMLSPVLLSMYSLFIRLGMVHNPGNSLEQTLSGIINGLIPQYGTNDQRDLNQAITGINKIIKIGYKNIFFKTKKYNYPVKSTIRTIHNQGGVVSYSSGIKFRKHWHREELVELEKQSTEPGLVI